MGKILTNDQIQQYHNDGYVFPVQAMSSAEAAGLTLKVEAFEAEYE